MSRDVDDLIDLTQPQQQKRGRQAVGASNNRPPAVGRVAASNTSRPITAGAAAAGVDEESDDADETAESEGEGDEGGSGSEGGQQDDEVDVDELLAKAAAQVCLQAESAIAVPCWSWVRSGARLALIRCAIPLLLCVLGTGRRN